MCSVVIVFVDLLYEDRWLFCSWQCSACPSPHPCQELLFVTSRPAGGQISCDMLNLCHKTIICIATNLNQLLTSRQAKNQCQKVLFGHFTLVYMYFAFIAMSKPHFSCTLSFFLNVSAYIYLMHHLAKCESGT